MSESAFANLLQFEATDAQPQARPSQSFLNPPQFGDYPRAVSPAAPEAAADVSAPPHDDDAAKALAEDAKRVEALAQEKQQAVEELQAARAAAEMAAKQLQQACVEVQELAKQEAVVMMRAMAEELFPELSREFLGHELARHIPDLLPRSAAEVTISTSVDVSLALEEALAHSDDMPASFFLKVEPALGDGVVEVAWDHGGYDFDFKALTAACKARYLPAPLDDKDDQNG
ncbi:hypothetical protein RYZ27_12085 [Hyphomonas sp. FCG-A18]|jgi:flagellar biosynthesis GTPase FlhF|uniref:hypothetical protein n=1 Tax=Hyphomonas sp. FCG-A18 TaxID=3080019 RepID=UPI002B292ECD|nr:hypothetical protein RYZ27_12085 [Hyphomonas sp. FCG-A18]